jgi:hypothetical protein
MTRHTHPTITAPWLRSSLARRLWAMRIDWHIVGWWEHLHEIAVSCYAEAQAAINSGGHINGEF